jgi:hypothetical protein
MAEEDRWPGKWRDNSSTKGFRPIEGTAADSEGERELKMTNTYKRAPPPSQGRVGTRASNPLAGAHADRSLDSMTNNKKRVTLEASSSANSRHSFNSKMSRLGPSACSSPLT